jgi:cytochrome c
MMTVQRLWLKTWRFGILFASAVLFAASIIMVPSGIAAAPPAKTKVLVGNPARGLSLYQSCTGCHSLDENEVGPKHRGIVGRRAAGVPGYAYSSALKKSNIVWNRPTLDRWLAAPQKVAPGSKMFFSVSNPQNRADIIAYLAQQH